MTRVGILSSLFICFLFLCFWPGMVPNQRQLSIVVSDWESYLGSLFPTCVLWVVSFCLVSALDRTVSVFHVVILFECFLRNKIS